METRVLYLVRHGREQEPDRERRFVGHIDPPLSDEGRDQARRLARRLAESDIGVAYCSDLARSRSTAAEIAGGRRGVEIVARADLREIDLGAWDGCTFREIARRFPDEFAARGADIACFRPPGGESFADCSERAVPVLQKILASSGNVLIVGHAGVNRVLLCHLLGMPVANVLRIRQDHACLNLIHRTSSGFELRLLNG
jgi:probable phosphoglycerate mutase